MQKIDLEMNCEDLKELFENYDYYTLESLGVMLKYVHKYNLNDTNVIHSKILQKKYEEACQKGDFEGRNEIILFFDLSEINKSINYLSEKEIIYLKNIIKDALDNISDTIYFEKIKEKLADTLTRIADISADIEEVDELSIKELKKFFNKYSVIELEKIDTIFQYVKDYDISTAIKIKNEVYIEKLKEYEKKFEVPVAPNGFTLLDFENNNVNLTNKEVNYLYTLVSDASLFLSSVREFADEYTYVNEEFNENEYPIDMINELESSLYYEIQKRKSKPKVYTKK